MKACGLIVEYNPFHNGHHYHFREAKKASEADCMITIMSGNFLQRGEPAIIDKFHRTRAALESGIDIVAELPYIYAVQSSDLFSKGSVLTLHELGVDSICFGSESGRINDFTSAFHLLKKQETHFKQILQHQLNLGNSFPEASRTAYKEIGLASGEMDLSKPNNILGFGYVRSILENKLPIHPLSIKRSKSGYHDQTISSTIASATSIRKQMLAGGEITPEVAACVPEAALIQLESYRSTTGFWHQWENYFPLLHYRIQTMSEQDLAAIQGVDEGIEYRIKKTAASQTSFNGWMEAMKTKRYTWTRLQRMFVHILTNTRKKEMAAVTDKKIPYIRILGFTQTGKKYLNEIKKDIQVPVITKLSKNMHPVLQIEERAANAYYSILPPAVKNQMHRQELQPPIMIPNHG